MTDPIPVKRRKLDHAQDDDNDAIYAGGLYKSSMFKLQVDELLAEVQPNYEKRAGVIDDALRNIKGLIEGIEDREGLSVSLKVYCFNMLYYLMRPADFRSHETATKIPQNCDSLPRSQT
jgi:U3 small nucleolar RNA-associated protein 22